MNSLNKYLVDSSVIAEKLGLNYLYVVSSCVQDSLTIINDAVVDHSIVGNTEPLTKFQFERIGYFCIDTYSTNSKVGLVCISCTLSFYLPLQVIFNKTLGLKEDAGK